MIPTIRDTTSKNTSLRTRSSTEVPENSVVDRIVPSIFKPYTARSPKITVPKCPCSAIFACCFISFVLLFFIIIILLCSETASRDFSTSRPENQSVFEIGKTVPNYAVLLLPQKNKATVPGPVWLPMVVPMLLISTFPLSLGKRSSTSLATSLASSMQAD